MRNCSDGEARQSEVRPAHGQLREGEPGGTVARPRRWRPARPRRGWRMGARWRKTPTSCWTGRKRWSTCVAWMPPGTPGTRRGSRTWHPWYLARESLGSGVAPGAGRGNRAWRPHLGPPPCYAVWWAVRHGTPPCYAVRYVPTMEAVPWCHAARSGRRPGPGSINIP